MPPAKSNPPKESSQKLRTSVKKKKNFFFKTSANNIKLTDKPKLDEKSQIKPSKNFARLPTKPDEASSNWKSLITQIKPVQSKGRLLYIERKKKEAAKKIEESSIGVTSSEKTNNDPEIWFDGVDPILLETPSCDASNIQFGSSGPKELTKVLALDCEMVGIGSDGKESALARVSIVNQHGVCVYDKFVAPGEEVTDFRTKFSGIRPHNLKNASQLGVVCHEVAEMLKGRLLIGHGLSHDLEVLMIKHPKSNIRDTSRFKVFRSVVNGATPSLKRLAQQFLGIEIQTGEHSSIQDAQAALRLYTMFHQQWEADLVSRRSERKSKIIKGKKSTKETLKTKETVQSKESIKK
ncbi:RNA exonuclease 4-like [Daphnia pulicaria]|uniref:RNA exonuclease 4-like n=1 Tax=Daphnia pulicaria TaxID=35523 RepID=UPI001EEA1B9F|nr:RNA exonuclease 4-like [Daphnia pulicaria]